MENHQLLVKEAWRAFDTADHLAYVTYPLVKEDKLVMTITDHINNALQHAMNALLEYERLYKRISYIPSEFMSKIDMLKQTILPRYRMQEYSNMILEMRNIIESHKKSDIEFARRGKIFIYSNSYNNLRSIGIDNVKKQLVNARKFIENIARITGENERRT